MVANVSSDGITDSKDNITGTITLAQVSPGSSVFVARYNFGNLKSVIEFRD